MRCGKLPECSSIALFTFRPLKPSLHVIVPPPLPPPSSVLCYSGPSPVAVDVSCCHRVAKVGPHLEDITSTTQSACNHTDVLTSFLFLSPSQFSPFLFCIMHGGFPIWSPLCTEVSNSTSQSSGLASGEPSNYFFLRKHAHTPSCTKR